MKTLYATLVVMVAVVVSAPRANAVPLPTWDKIINNGKARFQVLSGFGGTAVLDKETGLVWEQSPGTNSFTWSSAHVHCVQKVVGNRRGWRLPTIQELGSLEDPNSQSQPSLPTGHPFSTVQSSFFYWSATTFTAISTSAWSIVFDSSGVVLNGKANSFFVWCVRSGSGGPDEQ